MKKVSVLLLLVSMLLPMMSLLSYADGSVVYEGDAGEFVFSPGSKYSPTDLFTDFKSVMPGDSITQRITVRNDASKKVKVNIYMRSLGAHEDSTEFLSQLGLRVGIDQTSEMAYMFDARADQTAQLTDWVLLGTLYSGGEVDLEVALDVPITLDNNYKNLIGYLDWQFKVEEFPIEPDDPTPPDTGDETDILMWGVVFGLSLGMLVVLVLYNKKKKTSERGI